MKHTTTPPTTTAPVLTSTAPLTPGDWAAFIRAVAPMRLNLTTAVLALRLAAADGKWLDFRAMHERSRDHLQVRLGDHLLRWMRRRNRHQYGEWQPIPVVQPIAKGIGKENALAAKPTLLGQLGLRTPQQARVMLCVLSTLHEKDWDPFEVGVLTWATAEQGVTRTELNQLPWSARHSHPRHNVPRYREGTHALDRLVGLGLLVATHRTHGKGGPRKIRIWRTTTKGRVLLGGAWVAKERASSQPASAMERRAA